MNRVGKINLAASVVLFNPDIDVIENIKTYFEYVSHIYVVDNSDSSSTKVENELTHKVKISYIKSIENIGMASALNIALQKAIQNGFLFLLTMDQDSFFDAGSLSCLLEKISDEEKVGIYSPFHKNKYFTNPPKLSGMEEVPDTMTSGNILNLNVVKKNGFFKDEYFIDYVDIEYCMRLRKNGYKILRVNDAFLIHNEADLSKKRFLWKTVYPPNHNPSRWYYKIRNFFYLKEEYGKLFPEYFITEKQNIRNNIFKVIIFENKKLKKIKMIIRGFYHYKKRITGKLV